MKRCKNNFEIVSFRFSSFAYFTEVRLYWNQVFSILKENMLKEKLHGVVKTKSLAFLKKYNFEEATWDVYI